MGPTAASETYLCHLRNPGHFRISAFRIDPPSTSPFVGERRDADGGVIKAALPPQKVRAREGIMTLFMWHRKSRCCGCHVCCWLLLDFFAAAEAALLLLSFIASQMSQQQQILLLLICRPAQQCTVAMQMCRHLTTHRALSCVCVLNA